LDEGLSQFDFFGQRRAFFGQPFRYVERYDSYQAMLDYGCAALVAKKYSS
jgi:hypothetical protein